ncbi:MAG: 16S rRNA (guanine(527)-N(7))-methyltransferase RsmG [Clostridiales bacterium]|nr:16S rRNA (guanine(527)-N(7))-methyltransferase RsmG [Clostridiales bacterium]
MLEPLFPLLGDAGIAVTLSQREMLTAYAEMLYDWNARVNLTNVPKDEAWRIHFADALLPLAVGELFPQGASLIDVGTGAGFPGLPIAILRQDLSIVLLDALNKRCKFLHAVIGMLELANVRVVHARAEDGARGELRGAFDIACGRAVAHLRVLAEYLLPYVKVGGHALCWKGPAAQDEADTAQHAIHLLGGRLQSVLPIPVPDTGHQLVVIKKDWPTPDQYPRAAGTPAKKPL